MAHTHWWIGELRCLMCHRSHPMNCWSKWYSMFSMGHRTQHEEWNSIRGYKTSYIWYSILHEYFYKFIFAECWDVSIVKTVLWVQTPGLGILSPLVFLCCTRCHKKSVGLLMNDVWLLYYSYSNSCMTLPVSGAVSVSTDLPTSLNHSTIAHGYRIPLSSKDKNNLTLTSQRLFIHLQCWSSSTKAQSCCAALPLHDIADQLCSWHIPWMPEASLGA
jgi:hypothetical protein